MGFCEILNLSAWHNHARVQLSLQSVSELYFCLMLCAQRCLTLWRYALCSLLGSSVRGIFQAWVLEGVPISYSKGSSWARNWTHKSCISCIGRWILYYCATWPHPKEGAIFFFFWRFFESLLNLLQHCFCFMFFGFLATRYVGSHLLNQRANPYPLFTGRQSLNHGTVR